LGWRAYAAERLVSDVEIGANLAAAGQVGQRRANGAIDAAIRSATTAAQITSE
jgi:hypothetical protein